MDDPFVNWLMVFVAFFIIMVAIAHLEKIVVAVVAVFVALWILSLAFAHWSFLLRWALTGLIVVGVVWAMVRVARRVIITQVLEVASANSCRPMLAFEGRSVSVGCDQEGMDEVRDLGTSLTLLAAACGVVTAAVVVSLFFHDAPNPAWKTVHFLVFALVGLHASREWGSSMVGEAVDYLVAAQRNAVSPIEAEVQAVRAVGRRIQELSLGLLPPFNADAELVEVFEREQGVANVERSLAALRAEAESIREELERALLKLARVRRIQEAARTEVTRSAELKRLEEVDELGTILASGELMSLLSQSQWTEFDGYLERIARRLRQFMHGGSEADMGPNTLAWAFQVLGVEGGSPTYEELKAQYRILGRQLHPDRVPKGPKGVKDAFERKFKELQEAWAIVEEHFGR